MSAKPVRLQCKTKTGKYVLPGLTLKSTIASLKELISKATNIPRGQLKIFHGFPPKILSLGDAVQLSCCPFRSGDLLIVEDDQSCKTKSPSADDITGLCTARDDIRIPCITRNEGVSKLLNEGILFRKPVPANNSCLFTSIYAVMNNGKVNLSCSQQLRELTAAFVMSDPETYSTGILGQENEKYIKWITQTDSWGGGIEISVLSKHYKVEIDVVDTQTGRIDHFGEDQKYDQRVLLIYDGIHYDPLIFEPADYLKPVQTIFSTQNDHILQLALALASDAKKQQMYTDVGHFSLMCLVCQKQLTGQQEARQHCQETGHTNFKET